MKATTTVRRVVCIAATALVLTAGAGCRAADDVVRGVPKTQIPKTQIPKTQERPTPDQLKNVGDAACKAYEQRTGNDSPFC
jgi:hypothetical protein